MSTSPVRPLSATLAVFIVVLLFTACGGGEPKSVSEKIAASEGGTVSLSDDITLRIPAGALPEDVTISITRATEDSPAPGELEGAASLGDAFNIDLDGTHSYEYDALYRLTEVTYPDEETDTYTYDPVGNRLTKDTDDYTYDAADELTDLEGMSYDYDDNGNQTARGDDTFEYDHENRLTESVIDSVTSSSVYNGDGLRMSDTVGQTTTSYVWDVAAGLPAVLQDGANTYVYGLDLISATDGQGAQTYFTHDGLGSTTDLTDDEGDETDDYTYDIFGAIRSQSGSSDNFWLFTGEQQDADSDMYYLRARYYNPAIGRFLGRDPLTGCALQPQTQNRYAYVENNPANLVDPSGMCPRAEGGFVSPAYPWCRSPLGCWDVDLDALRALFSEYWECVSFGLAIAAVFAPNPWLAAAVVGVDAAGEISLQGDVEGATGSTLVGGGATALEYEINQAAKLYKPKYMRWDQMGVTGFGRSLKVFAAAFTGFGCAKRLGILKPMGINP